MRATLYYTLMRLVLFAVVLGVLALAGVRSFLLLALAILISGLLSYFVLSRQRTNMSTAIARRVTNFRERLDAGTRAEDRD
jgi:cell division protein FtsW (lipid II flippase)